MPATVLFAPSLVSGALLLGNTNVVTQVTGLVEVNIDYICRRADLDAQLDKFFLDAPPPTFPTRAISAATLKEGKLFMVNYGVQDQYGVVTISAKYVGVTSKPIKPYLNFAYKDFNTLVGAHVSLTGFFGSAARVQQQFPNEPDNDFAALQPAFFVGFKGRLEEISYNFATLDTAFDESALVRPPADRVFAEVVLSGDIEEGLDFNGTARFGSVFNSTIFPPPPEEEVPGSVPPFTSEQPNFTANDVAAYAAAQSGVTFTLLTINEWQERDIYPLAYISVSRRTVAITPSVYIREFKFTPFIDQTR